MIRYIGFLHICQEEQLEYYRKTLNIAKNPKYDGYQKGYASMVYKCLIKKSSDSDIGSKIVPNQQLAEELHNQLLGKLKNEKYYHHSGCWSRRYAINKQI